MVSTLFDGIDKAADSLEFTLKMSAVEIYMERIIDLLAPPSSDSKVNVREDPVRGVWVDAVERHAATEEDVLAVAHTAQASRRVAATCMNVRSSRSHYILMLRLTALDKQTDIERTGVLYLVDLAGSEKVSQTGATGQTLEEAKKINRSLSCLGNVIVSLTEEKGCQHVPYRDSKLTRVLQQSLGGNAKTALIATCSLASSCLDETLTTLRFGERVKNICNMPKINEQRSKEQLLRDLNNSTLTIEALKRDLASFQKCSLEARPCFPPSPTRSIGTCTSTLAAAQTSESNGIVLEIVSAARVDVGQDISVPEPSDDINLEFGGLSVKQEFMQLREELNAMRCERDTACDRLSQMHKQTVPATKTSAILPEDLHTPTRR